MREIKPIYIYIYNRNSLYLSHASAMLRIIANYNLMNYRINIHIVCMRRCNVSVVEVHDDALLEM